MRIAFAFILAMTFILAVPCTPAPAFAQGVQLSIDQKISIAEKQHEIAKLLIKDGQYERVLPEMSAKVAFLSREVAPEEMKSFTAVNQSAIVTRDGKKALFLVEGGKAKEVAVTTGKQMGDMVEILQGAKAGDKVILNPSGKLRDGSKIKTEEK